MSARLATVEIRSCLECPHRYSSVVDARVQFCKYDNASSDVARRLPESAMKPRPEARIPRWCPLPKAPAKKRHA